jgi:hypothetical protein
VVVCGVIVICRSTFRTLVAALTIVVANTASAPAHAADPAEVERLLQEGIRLRREGSDSRALPLFQKAHDLAHTPRTAAQLGLVEFALGYSVDSATHLSQGLAVSNDPWIQANRAVLEKALADVRANVGEVEVSGAPGGADVRLNGASVGTLPLASPVQTDQGPKTIELRAPGYVAKSTSVNVVGGKRTLVHLELEPEHSLSPVSPTTAPGANLADSPGSKDSATSPTRTIVGWTLVGAGAAAAATGGVLLATAKDCTPMAGFQCAHEPASRVPGWTLLGVGLATGVAGAIVLITRPTAHTEVGLAPSYVFLRGQM